MKYFCIGRNFVGHIEELRNDRPERPVIFIKPESATHKGKEYTIPSFTKEMNYECELVLKFHSDLSRGSVVKDWRDVISELSLGVDFTARDLQQYQKDRGLPWEIAKAFDGSALIGNWRPISAYKDMDYLEYFFYKGDQLLQCGDTRLMICSILEMINYILQFFTVNKGDVLFTGTPQGVGLIQPGASYRGVLGDEEVLNFCTLK